ncbi:MAG: SCO family protein [Bacteroidetes bacterium]|jgi:protein SCO1/2|nr:SCO family protein [Bacteroidota bacterium]
MRPLTVVLILALLIGCSGSEDRPEVVTYPVTGAITKIDREKNRLFVAHDEIPGFMDAMTMPFRIKDTTLFAGLAPGDTISGTLVVGRHESWLEAIVVAGRGTPQVLRPEQISAVKPFEVGDRLPDIALTDQEGRPFRLSSLHGKVVAVTFIYTLCPLPDFCIRMTSHFADAQRSLKRNRALAGDWHLVSISFDPDRDVPPLLKAYAMSHGADLTTWTFATAPKASLADFLAGFGLFFSENEAGVIDHNLRTVIIDADGRLAKVFTGNEWTPRELAEAIRAAS